MSYKYIVIDDDPINNMVCSYTINKVIEGAEIKCFEFPSEGLQYIQAHYMDTFTPSILLLDINMPLINGWDFLDSFALMSEHIHSQFTIYIVSSSIDPEDQKRALVHKFVREYLPKPISPDTVKHIAAA